ncbi:squalene/phytoene synthase family protein [Gimibacter soli]|uniref:Squalene/phytoene synthase family protein n=1 Tax=Gimibacter soli TaxID=3024400 RepID=A0AAF0BJ90_9PROT|nr:squalene/phytoene synthase family protein [Gimibacter soli]WCL52844.1 squalene/phytoene synthase family protein [Gimibacter soli]
MILQEKTAGDIAGALESCRTLVESHDHDRYVMALFAPSGLQPQLFALLACNHEIAKTRESVSDPMIGEIRLQWWQEAIEGLIVGEGREHPVVTGLATVKDLSAIAPLLFSLIEARRSDLDEIGLADFLALQAYTAAVGGKLNEAVAIVLGTKADSEGARAARAAGDAWAMVGLLRAMIFEIQTAKAASSRLLPGAEVEGTLNRSVNTINADMAPSLMPVIHRMLDAAEANITEARRLARAVPKAQRAPLLLATLAARHIRRFRSTGDGMFSLPEEGRIGPGGLLRLMWAQMIGRY